MNKVIVVKSGIVVSWCHNKRKGMNRLESYIKEDRDDASSWLFDDLEDGHELSNDEFEYLFEHGWLEEFESFMEDFANIKYKSLNDLYKKFKEYNAWQQERED